MWRLTYNLLLNAILPFFLLFSIMKPKIRKTLLERLWGTTSGMGLTNAIWLHAASVGEAAIAQNIIGYMTKHGTFEEFLVTTNTYYTRDLLRSRMGKMISVASLPFDLSYSLCHFIGPSSFKALLIVETEIWPNLIWCAKRRKVPVFILNGRISDSTLKTYIRISFFMKNVLSSVDAVFAQSQEQKERFIAIGMDADRIHTTGNLKYYRESAQSGDAQKRDTRITFGSIKEKELDLVIPVIYRLKKKYPTLQVFLAPREMHLINTLEDAFSSSFSTIRYSRYTNTGPTPSSNPDIVIVDTVGDLLGIYETSMVAFVGGSLAPYGGQNMLEPLFFGTPVLFGPHVENFRDIASTILDEHAGIMVKDGEELYQGIDSLLQDESMRERMGNSGRRIIEMQKEAMEKTVGIMMDTVRRQDGRIYKTGGTDGDLEGRKGVPLG
jgi:3-deoxy-D-manno-octulosonic-acid transferase